MENATWEGKAGGGNREEAGVSPRGAMTVE